MRRSPADSTNRSLAAFGKLQHTHSKSSGHVESSFGIAFRRSSTRFTLADADPRGAPFDRGEPRRSLSPPSGPQRLQNRQGRFRLPVH